MITLKDETLDIRPRLPHGCFRVSQVIYIHAPIVMEKSEISGRIWEMKVIIGGTILLMGHVNPTYMGWSEVDTSLPRIAWLDISTIVIALFVQYIYDCWEVNWTIAWVTILLVGHVNPRHLGWSEGATNLPLIAWLEAYPRESEISPRSYHPAGGSRKPHMGWSEDATNLPLIAWLRDFHDCD